MVREKWMWGYRWMYTNDVINYYYYYLLMIIGCEGSLSIQSLSVNILGYNLTEIPYYYYYYYMNMCYHS